MEREWLEIGHGLHADVANELCSVFLQWLDCVHQVHRQFDSLNSIEFNSNFLGNTNVAVVVEVENMITEAGIRLCLLVHHK